MAAVWQTVQYALGPLLVLSAFSLGLNTKVYTR